MKRRAAAPDRFYLEDPSFDRQIQRALNLSLSPSPARRDPETSSSDKTPEDDVAEPTAYFGVDCLSGRYRASIKKARGNPHVLGWYATCTEAAAAYDEAALRIFKDKAETNFEPPSSKSQPLFNAPLPWKEDVWKPRPATWYETLISDAIKQQP